MIENQFGHLKHADAILALKYFLQPVVWLDKSLIGGVLEIMATDVIPKFASDLRT